MTQRIDGEGHQITRNGDIIICHGGATCPFRDAPESQRHAEFARATGIWCPRGAREVFEWLIADHGFTAPRLRAAWKGDNVAWDQDSKRLITKIYWFEPVVGYGLIAVCAYLFLMLSAQLLLVESKNDWRLAIAYFAAMTAYGGAVWFAAHHILGPYRVAKRVRSVLAIPSAQDAILQGE